MGGYERNPDPWAVEDGPPADFNGKLLPEDWPRFEALADAASSLIPALGEAGVVRLLNGPEAFTPDGEFILGESDVAGFFVAAGFCAHGIAGAAGIGKVIAEWIVEGEPEWDVWKMDVRRFGAHYRSRSYARDRAYEVYATYYDIHYPGEERQAGRPLKLPPAYAQLQALDAEFGEKSGWERVNWFRSNEDPEHEGRRPRGWAGEHWSTAIVTEHLACRERAALFDESSFSKLEVSGDDALSFLQRICSNDVDREPGSVVYTQMLSRRGGIESDLTVTRLVEDRFRLVIGTAFGNHDLAWIRKQRRPDERLEVKDVTGAYACYGIWGPVARDVLESLTDADLSNAAFPYLSARQIDVGMATCLALRVTYVGELGWELYAPAEFGASLWDELVEAGRDHGLVPAGYRAIDSLRVEKGYLAWGSDITPEEDPFQAGLGFAVAKGKDFLGREALEARRGREERTRLACLVLDDPRRDGPGERTRVRRRAGRLPRDERRDRLRGRPVDRVRLPSGGPRRARNAAGNRGVRRTGRHRGRPPADLGPGRRADQGLREGPWSNPASTSADRWPWSPERAAGSGTTSCWRSRRPAPASPPALARSTTSRRSWRRRATQGATRPAS